MTARINSDLRERLEKKLKLSRPRIYQLIEEKARTNHLPRNLAAIALAAERGINVSRYSTEEELAEIRRTVVRAAPRPVTLPPADTPTPRPSRTKAPQPKKSISHDERRGTTVFVVHGRDRRLKDSMFAFLRALELRPLEWNHAIKLTNEPSPYVGTILEAAFRTAAAIVVLLTPDDEARLKPSLHGTHEPEYEKKATGQARPNVLFEAGMAFGRNPENTVLVQIGELRPFSDVAGRHIVKMSGEATSRLELATKLANAGCNVNTTGSDWLTAGDFKFGNATRNTKT
jgi:predicted nucleotide-binding protein